MTPLAINATPQRLLFPVGAGGADFGRGRASPQVAASARKRATAEEADEEEEEWRRRRGGEGSVGLRQGAGRKGRWERSGTRGGEWASGVPSGRRGRRRCAVRLCDYAFRSLESPRRAMLCSADCWIGALGADGWLLFLAVVLGFHFRCPFRFCVTAGGLEHAFCACGAVTSILIFMPGAMWRASLADRLNLPLISFFFFLSFSTFLLRSSSSCPPHRQ